MAYEPNKWGRWRGRKDHVRKLTRLEAAVADGEGGGGGGLDGPLISEDEDNAATEGTDGGVFVPESQAPGDYVTWSALAALLKYAAPIAVLEEDEDENDLPADFPTSPFYTGGTPPIVIGKKEEA